jgi:hypothetical protein
MKGHTAAIQGHIPIDFISDLKKPGGGQVMLLLGTGWQLVESNQGPML